MIFAGNLFIFFFFFFFNDTATTEIYTAQYTLSLHDARPIWRCQRPRSRKSLNRAQPSLARSLVLAPRAGAELIALVADEPRRYPGYRRSFCFASAWATPFPESSAATPSSISARRTGRPCRSRHGRRPLTGSIYAGAHRPWRRDQAGSSQQG